MKRERDREGDKTKRRLRTEIKNGDSASTHDADVTSDSDPASNLEDESASSALLKATASSANLAAFWVQCRNFASRCRRSLFWSSDQSSSQLERPVPPRFRVHRPLRCHLPLPHQLLRLLARGLVLTHAAGGPLLHCRPMLSRQLAPTARASWSGPWLLAQGPSESAPLQIASPRQASSSHLPPPLSSSSLGQVLLSAFFSFLVAETTHSPGATFLQPLS